MRHRQGLSDAWWRLRHRFARDVIERLAHGMWVSSPAGGYLAPEIIELRTPLLGENVWVRFHLVDEPIHLDCEHMWNELRTKRRAIVTPDSLEPPAEPSFAFTFRSKKSLDENARALQDFIRDAGQEPSTNGVARPVSGVRERVAG